MSLPLHYHFTTSTHFEFDFFSFLFTNSFDFNFTIHCWKSNHIVSKIRYTHNNRHTLINKLNINKNISNNIHSNTYYYRYYYHISFLNCNKTQSYRKFSYIHTDAHIKINSTSDHEKNNYHCWRFSWIYCQTRSSFTLT